MMSRIGLVGYPNVGKSSIFQLLTNKEVLIANYPFSTINPNIGFLELYDERTLFLKDFFHSKKITSSNFELVDIAGIIKGASQKIGLGGEFLSHIRSSDLVCHVIRCFKNDNISHVESRIDAVKDFENIQLEFIIADIKQIERKLDKLRKLLRKENNKDLIKEGEVLEKVLEELKKEIPISSMEWLSDWEEKIIKSHNLLTIKPSIIIANYDGEDFKEVQRLKDKYKNAEIIPLSVNLEKELKGLSQKETEELGLNFFEREKLSNSIKKALKLKTFFTAGKNESRNWIIKSNANAIDCAGLIHSDIKNRFIKLEVYNFDEIRRPTFNIKNLKKEPASYMVKDGDICNFLFNK